MNLCRWRSDKYYSATKQFKSTSLFSTSKNGVHWQIILWYKMEKHRGCNIKATPTLTRTTAFSFRNTLHRHWRLRTWSTRQNVLGKLRRRCTTSPSQCGRKAKIYRKKNTRFHVDPDERRPSRTVLRVRPHPTSKLLIRTLGHVLFLT